MGISLRSKIPGERSKNSFPQKEPSGFLNQLFPALFIFDHFETTSTLHALTIRFICPD